MSKKADLRFYTTTDAVGDLDAVRKALGVEQINLMGVSYGTRVAQQYTLRHPQHTRTVLLILLGLIYAGVIAWRVIGQVIGWKSKMVDGKVVLTALRIKEVVVEDGDDFGQTKVEQIRYLTPGKVEIYRKAKDADGAANWALFEGWQTSRQDITLVTLYTKRTGFMCGSPPLLNMALLNIKHWQSQSEQDNILHVARVPLLTVFGLEEGQDLVIGSSSATSFSDRQRLGLDYV